MAGLGSKSALASLTETYTDSEEEDNIAKGGAGSDSPERNDDDVAAKEDIETLSEENDQVQETSEGKSPVVHDAPLTETEITDAGVAGSTRTTSSEAAESRIPKEPSGKPTEELQKRVTNLYGLKMSSHVSLNTKIQKNKQFRNPSIYEKLIAHCNIDELGTNFPPNIYNPHGWDESSFHDELAKVQKADMDRREKEKKDRAKVEFISGTAKKPPIPGLPGAPVADEGKRKSKWDQRGSVIPILQAALPTLQPGVVQPNLTTNVTGTKSTVISAFGHLPVKKPK